MHDLGFDKLCEALTDKKAEQTALLNTLSSITDSPEAARYRADVFEDIYNNPKLCDQMIKLLDKINFLRDYGVFRKRNDDVPGIWDLMHSLEEMKEYIGYVEAMHSCLEDAPIRSEGLCELRDHIENIYNDYGYAALKNDVAKLKASTEALKSVTVGINLNQRFEAESLGLISINSKSFTKSNVIGEFYDKISGKDHIRDDADWNGSMKFRQVKPEGLNIEKHNEETGEFVMAMRNPLMAAHLARVPEGDGSGDITRYMNREADHLISNLVKNIRETLNKYMNLSITDVTELIPELMFYIRFADYIRKLSDKGFCFSKPRVFEGASFSHKMEARGIYNLKLINHAIENKSEIVKNDIDFDEDKLLYLLTGANRGGKTTITQAVGQLFVLAQNGIFVPADSFLYEPVDCVYTHFPADEDQTMDLGRLGEECKRFRELYFDASDKSLLLLNETFSTTSFEEGYYIAYDSVRAIAEKGIRTIYNTHMHKLAFEMTADDNSELPKGIKSLVIRSGEGNVSFKIAMAKPEGMSYARTIADKYGVTYELLSKER
ncbi:MAG: DNA mismatch repair protein [Lachnospiraceae bacterium]|nr:DNA mismatch repair protein [Lachnospiraceae bacterium]